MAADMLVDGAIGVLSRLYPMIATVAYELLVRLPMPAAKPPIAGAGPLGAAGSIHPKKLSPRQAAAVTGMECIFVAR